MFKKGDVVLYCTHGVCTVSDITEKTVDGTAAQYYVLSPVYDARTTFFIPRESEELKARMRPVMPEDEIRELIAGIPAAELMWIEDENLRKVNYKEIIITGDREKLISLIKTLHLHREQQREKGRKMHVSDENFFRDAERILYDELAYVLKIDRDEVFSFVADEIEKKTLA